MKNKKRIQQKDESKSGFNVKSLLLVESNFKRINKVTFNDPNSKQNVDIDVKVKVNERTVIVQETLNFSIELNEVPEVSCSIVMAGIFEKVGDSKIEDLEQFGKVNGAAIIFPFIREHLANLSSKAGIGVILLPPFNFTSRN